MSLNKLKSIRLKEAIKDAHNIYVKKDNLPVVAPYFRQKFRNVFKNYFNYRYLLTKNTFNFGKIFKFSKDQFQVAKPLANYESKMQELFELSSKAKFFSASLLSINISECSTVDSYKENYPFTVNNFFFNFKFFLKVCVR